MYLIDGWAIERASAKAVNAIEDLLASDKRSLAASGKAEDGDGR